MGDAQEQEEERRKREERREAMQRQEDGEEFWYPNREQDQEDGRNAGCYFTTRTWVNDEITTLHPMRFTDHPSRYAAPKDSLQIVSIKIASIRGGLRWPIDVFGMITARDVLDNRMRNIIFARARSNCQTIDEEHPYLELTGPMRAIGTCIDPGNIEIVLKVKGATRSEDKDLSFLVLLLKSRDYISYDGEYPSKHSTLKFGFHHMGRSVEATISVRLTGRSSLAPGGFQGVFTASIASIDDAEILLLAFRDGKLPIASDGTVTLSRRVVSVRLLDWEELKVSIVAVRCEVEEQVATRDDIVFTPKMYGRSCGVLKIGTCKMQVTVAWSLVAR